jgi:hypothetical protein
LSVPAAELQAAKPVDGTSFLSWQGALASREGPSADKRKGIPVKLKEVSAKVLIFLHRTDVREERLAHVIESLDTELFLRSAGRSHGS